MMTLTQNGEPVVVKHECPDKSRIGKCMTAEELHEFSVKIFARWVKSSSVSVDLPEQKGSPCDCMPDLYAIREIYPQKVAYMITNKGIKDELDFSYMQRLWYQKECIPKLITADLYCLNTNGGEALCGADFIIKFTSKSLLPGEKNAEVEPKSSEQLAILLKQAWEHLDVSIIEPYFDKDMHYKSDWVFEDMCSRLEYVHYLKDKFNALRDGSNRFRIRIGKSAVDGSLALLLNESVYNGQLVMFIEFLNGRISSLWLRELNATV